MNHTAAIQINGLCKAFGSHVILQDIHLEIRTGEYVGLIGVNGAGKTTLIKCILDFCNMDAGDISITGIAHRYPAARQKITYLPERFTPPYYLAGRDFLQYMSGLSGVGYSGVQAEELMNTLDLDKSALDRLVREYSKGMGQKLGLLASFISGRDIMIFDEPMSGLDPKARALLKRHLLTLKQQGKTLFYSTHLLEDVEAICDRVIILHDGRVCFNGTADECCQKFNATDFESAYLACVDGVSSVPASHT